MAQKNKTKEEFIEEIKLLQKRIVELEKLDGGRKQQQNIRRLATVVRDSNDAITLRDFDGQIIAWNHGAELMYGYSEEEALQMNVLRLTPPDKEMEHAEFIRRLKASEPILSFETQRVAKDGRILDVWLTVTKVLDDMGKPIGIATTERDITERKRVEEALKESEEKFRNVFDNATDGIILTDLENQEIYSMNKSMCQMLGYGLGESNKLKMIDIHPKEDMSYVFEQVEKQSKDAFTPEKDIPMKRKDGSVFYVSVRGTPIILSGKRYLLGIFRDVTERKKMEEESQKRLHELEVFYKASVGREERIIELKKEIEMLKKELGK